MRLATSAKPATISGNGASSGVFDPAHHSIKVMTLHVSKGLEFPVVALVGAGRMPTEDEREEARQ